MKINRYFLPLFLVLISLIYSFDTETQLASGVQIESNEFLSTIDLIKSEEIPQKSEETEIKSFWESFWAGFWLIIVSEIGDKTFFLTMIYAATNSMLETFVLSSVIMLLLNLSSLLIGYAIPFLVYRSLLDWLAIIIFTIFGLHLLYDGLNSESVFIEKELEELKEEVVYSKSRDGSLSQKQFDTEFENKNLKETLLPKELPEKNGKIIVQSALAYCGTLLLAEIGDRSQITTIIIAAVYEFYGVLLGTSIAHVLTILLAIFCGYYLSKHLTTRQVLIMGGVMFIIFAFIYMLEKIAIIK